MSACRRTATAVVLALVVLLLPGVVSVAVAADTTPPGPVTALTAASGAGKLTLRWKNPAASDLSGVLLVRKTGTTPPTSATDGTQVARVAKPAVTYADTLLDANTAYAYALFAYDSSGNRSVRTTVSARTAVQPPAVVRLSGTLAASVVLTPTKGRLFVLESLTVPAGRTLTLGAGTTTKVRLSVAVAGALRTAGTPAAPAVVTSYYDDSIAGNTDGTVEPVVNNQLTIALRSGGTVALTGAQLHWGRVWNYDVARDRTATATLTDSALLDFSVELAYSPGQTVSLLGNTFTRANLYLSAIDRPVLRGNRFVDGKGLGFGYAPGSPVWLGQIADLAGVGANTATGTPAQRAFQFADSTVRSSWTLQPAAGFTYVLGNVTVAPTGTLTAGPGSLVKATSSGVNVGGALRSTGTTDRPAVWTSLHDDSIGGDIAGTDGPVENNLTIIALRSGGTVALTGAQLHWGRLWNYDVARDRTATATLTDSALLDFSVELAYSPGQTVSLLGNTFTRANLYLSAIDRPVLRGNRFVDGKGLGFGYAPGSPVWLGQIADLAGVGANTATGTPAQRAFQFADSTVRSSWTLQPAAGFTYILGNVTVAPTGTLTAGPGSLVKATSSGVNVGGALRSTGTTDRPAVWTSLHDDSIGGDIAGTDGPVENNLTTIALRSGGTVALTGAQLHWGRLWNYDVARDRTATATLTDSALLDFSVELAYSPGQTVSLLGNTFTRANLYLSAIDRPVLRGNRFVDGKGLGFGYAPGSPVWLGQIADLSEVEANRASGTAPQRVLQFASSGVRGTWTLGPASVAVYVLADVTVESGGTMQVLDGALLKNAGDVRVLAGGTLTATGARVTAVGDDSVGGNSDGDNGSSSWPGFDVLSGAAATISGSTFTRAAVALDVNGDWFTAGGDADVSATGSQFSENAFDIANGPKDEVGAVDAGGSFALLISTHEHGCTRPAPNQDFYTRTLVDVEGTGRQDDPPCKPGYVESDSH